MASIDGRLGLFAAQLAGMRTTRPARSIASTSPRKRAASAGSQRRGWNMSPASTIVFSQAQASLASCTGASSCSSLALSPAYSRNACPSGKCRRAPAADRLEA